MRAPRLWPHNPTHRPTGERVLAVSPPGGDGGRPRSLDSEQPGRAERWLSGGRRTTITGGLIVALGVALSGFLASQWRTHAEEANRQSFMSVATDLGGVVQAKLASNLDLTRAMRAIASLEPHANETRFQQWYDQLQRGVSIPSNVVATLIQPVLAAHLAEFRRSNQSDPAFRALTGGGDQILPAGRRPLYCLTRAIVGAAAASDLAGALFDYCAATIPGIGASPYPAIVHSAVDTGSFIVTTVPIGSPHSLVAIGAAVYRPGARLATVPERRAATIGVIGTTFDSAVLISSALGSRRSLSLSLYHRNMGAPLQMVGSRGDESRSRSSGYSTSRDLGDGWVAEVSGTPEHSLSVNTQGLVALGLGLLVTFLLFLLYRVLSRSRRRAWSLVGEKTEELAYSALHDPLTDLPNRRLVLDRAEQILARARRLDAPVTALFVDIDSFKQINDRYGHQVGDEVLRQVGSRLGAILRDNDTVGRLGGDEFVMLIDALGLTAAPELVAERILDVLRQPIELGKSGHPQLLLTASIGIATGRLASAEALMQDADLALYKAKAVGKDGYVKFEVAMHTAAQDRMHLEIDLAAALPAEQFFLLYQPMLDLETERVAGVEALLRWRHPMSGVISPELFIPIAEESGLIVEIGRWALDQACAQGAAWRKRGFDLNISVNVSARQLECQAFVEEVRLALQRNEMDPASLTLEITETVLMRNPLATAELLADLKTLGVRIAVDDFGTGYSSLAYLRQFPVDSLKIDRTFITGLGLSNEGHALTHTLIQLGKALGLQTLAEGVEQHSQVRELQREGCDLAQGFLFARPLAPDVLESFLRDGSGFSGTFAEESTLPTVS